MNCLIFSILKIIELIFKNSNNEITETMIKKYPRMKLLKYMKNNTVIRASDVKILLCKFFVILNCSKVSFNFPIIINNLF